MSMCACVCVHVCAYIRACNKHARRLQGTLKSLSSTPQYDHPVGPSQKNYDTNCYFCRRRWSAVVITHNYSLSTPQLIGETKRKSAWWQPLSPETTHLSWLTQKHLLLKTTTVHSVSPEFVTLGCLGANNRLHAQHANMCMCVCPGVIYFGVQLWNHKVQRVHLVNGRNYSCLTY